ncbi:hypothetical protein VTH06DRAFT_3136 [Thermothelomyces fergusii]
MPRKGILGFGRLFEGIRATRNDRGPQYVIEAMDGEMGKDVHTIVVPIHDYELLVSRDPVNIQAVLVTRAADWDVSEHRTASWEPMVGHGIFTSRGESWKHSRALIRPQFAMDQINDFDMYERHVQQLFVAIDRHCDGPRSQGWTVVFDLQPLFYNLALDVMTEMLYGYSVHSQNPSERAELPVLDGHEPPDREHIGMHMDAGKAWVETRGAMWKYRWLLPSLQFHRHCAAIHQYAGWFVQLRLRQGDLYLDNLQQQGGLANRDRYVLLHELAKATQDPVELRSQTLNVLTAGRDTTAALLSWIVPGRPSGIEFRRVRDSMPYMNAVINETLRMAPVVPLNDRISLRDTVLPRGGGPKRDQPVFVPAGTQILIPIYALAQRPDLWGPDAAVFRPERWTEDGGCKPGFEYIPFGGGARQCLGQQLARLESAYIIIRLLQRYNDIANAEVPPDAAVRFHHTIENRSGSGVQVRLHVSDCDADKTLRGHKLLILAPWQQAPAGFLERLAAAFPDLTVVYHVYSLEMPPSADAIPDEAWRDVTILFTFRTIPTPEQVPKLQYVQLMSAGANHVLDERVFKDTEVAFCTANGVHGPQISEWIISTYLAFEHRLPTYLEHQKQGRWNRGDMGTIEDATDKTIGILGYGSIGRQTARVASAMGMKVYAYTLHPRPTPESRRDRGWTPPGLGDPDGSIPARWFAGGSTADLHAFLRAGLDLLVIATPLTGRTRHLLSADEFAQAARRGRTFVSNVARGPVVDADALLRALETGQIRGAALDVTDPEPLPDGHPLWAAPNLIVTPHVSGASTRYADRVLAILEANLHRLAEGAELINRVDRRESY